MTSTDYFLFDNRTAASWGNDWGIKAATGALSQRPDLRREFAGYCNALPSTRGRLAGFDSAAGGIRNGDGYLLCVTIETPDRQRRPSWAVIGIWCRNRVELEEVLKQDPIGSARELLKGATPPPAFPLFSTNALLRSDRRPNSGTTTFQRFQPGSTPDQVLSMLLGTARDNDRLPNILGITASSTFSTFARQGFDLVYCHPMDEADEALLVRYFGRSEPQPELTKGRDRQALVATSGRTPSGGIVVVPPAFVLSLEVLLFLAILLAIFVRSGPGLHLVAPPAAPGPLVTRHPVVSATAASTTTSLADSHRQEGAEIGIFAGIKSCLAEFKILEPAALRDSKGFQDAHDGHLVFDSSYRAKRDRILQAYESLLNIRERLVSRPGGGYVAFYYEGPGAKQPNATRLEKIAAVLNESPLGREDCEALKAAFRHDFQREGSELSHWCGAIETLDRTATPLLRGRASPSPKDQK